MSSNKGKHKSKPPKSPRFKYNQMIQNNKDEDKKRKIKDNRKKIK